MKKISIFFILLIHLNMVLNSAKIHPDAGKTAASFLKIPVGVRASSVGGGYTAVLGDLFSSFYNPAGSVGLSRGFSFMHNIHFSDISQYVFVYGFKPSFLKGKNNYLSLSLNYLNYGSLDRRSGFYETDPYNPSPVEGSFKARDIAFMGSYSFKISDVNFGINLKYINQLIDDKSADGFALDIGGIKRINVKGRDFNVGLSVLNIGPKLKMVSDSYPLPLAFKFGVLKEYRSSFFSFDVVKYRDNYPFLIAGFENKIKQYLYLRLGYRYRIYGNELGFWSGFSSGLGFDYNNISFGYSLTPYGELGYSHKIELSIRY